MRAAKRPVRNRVRPRIRVHHGEEIALGPGKADLLEKVRDESTLSGAARALGMSYMRAWLLLRTMNRCFRRPLTQTSRGGRRRGVTRLTRMGKAVLGLYRRMEEKALEASAPTWRRLRRNLKS